MGRILNHTVLTPRDKRLVGLEAIRPEGTQTPFDFQKSFSFAPHRLQVFSRGVTTAAHVGQRYRTVDPQFSHASVSGPASVAHCTHRITRAFPHLLQTRHAASIGAKHHGQTIRCGWGRAHEWQ